MNAKMWLETEDMLIMSSFLPAAKPTGPRAVRVVIGAVVVMVVWKQFDVNPYGILFFPLIIFFGVGSIAPWPYFSSGWEPI